MTERAMSMNVLFDGMADMASGNWPAVTDLCLDSRQVAPGAVFVALAGLQAHGLDFVEEACRRGAVAVVHDGRGRAAERPDLPAPDVPTLVVPDLAKKLPELAARMWGQLIGDMDLVAVTGTNGKTSVAWLLAQALDGAMLGTLGCGRPDSYRPGELTTPDIFSVYRQLAALAASGVKTVVIEASSHALDQGRLAGLEFSSVIFTALGHDHLDYHGDRAAYGAAKMRLFTEFSSARWLVNLDDEFGRQIAALPAAGQRLVGYSLDAGQGAADSALRAAVVARPRRIDMQGLVVEFETGGGLRFEAHSALLGRINIYNLLVVVAELGARRFKAACIADCLGRLVPVPGRMEPVGGGAQPLAIVDYAHTPDALQKVLLSIRELTAGRLWCVFGCGGDRDRAKRPLVGRIAENLADRVVLTDDNPRTEDGLGIVRAIQAGMAHPERARVIRKRPDAIAFALQECGAGDVVLIAGKGHETEQIVGNERLECDDRQSARRALGVAA